MNNDGIWALVRMILGYGGAALAAHGLASSSDVSSAIGNVMTIGPALVSLISFAAGVYSHWNMKKIPSSAVAVRPDDAPNGVAKGVTVTGKVIGAIVLALALSQIVQGDAKAQAAPFRPKTPAQIKSDIDNALNIGNTAPRSSLATLDSQLASFGKKIQEVNKDLADKVIADVTAAATDATNRNDLVSLPCWNSINDFAKQLPAEWATPPALPIGPALSIQIGRDLVNAISSNGSNSIKVACAALIGDQLTQVVQLAAMFGFAL